MSIISLPFIPLLNCNFLYRTMLVLKLNVWKMKSLKMKVGLKTSINEIALKCWEPLPAYMDMCIFNEHIWYNY